MDEPILITSEQKVAAMRGDRIGTPLWVHNIRIHQRNQAGEKKTSNVGPLIFSLAVHHEEKADGNNVLLWYSMTKGLVVDKMEQKYKLNVSGPRMYGLFAALTFWCSTANGWFRELIWLPKLVGSICYPILNAHLKPANLFKHNIPRGRRVFWVLERVHNHLGQ